MKKGCFIIISKSILVCLYLLGSIVIFAQGPINPLKPKPYFWDKVQIGGDVNFSMSTGYTNASLAPSAIYHFNETLALGAGFQLGYISSKDNFDSTHYGVTLIGLVNPIPEIQLSGELEQTRYNVNNYYYGAIIPDDFWNTSLFLGGGYRAGNVTIGVKYDVLHNSQSVYDSAFMPFMRIYF